MEDEENKMDDSESCDINIQNLLTPVVQREVEIPGVQIEAAQDAGNNLVPDGKYEKVKNRATGKGELFEVKMAAFLFLCLKICETINSFRIASNVVGAKALDDILLSYSTRDNPNVMHRCFIQLKHVASKTLNKFCFINDPALKLIKYLDSFIAIKEIMSRVEKSVMFEGSFKNSQFIMYTNASLHPEMLPRESVESEINTLLSSRQGCIFKFDKKTDSDIVNSLMTNPGTTTIADEFLQSFTVFSGQANESELDDMIKAQLLLACAGNTMNDINGIYPFYVGLFWDWWQADDGVILHQDSDIVTQAINRYRVSNITQSQEKIFGLNVIFENVTLYTDDITNNPLVHLVPSLLCTKLTCTKLLQSLSAVKCGSIFLGLDSLLSHTEAVMSVWRNGKNHTIVIVSDSVAYQCELCYTLLKQLEECNIGICRLRMIIVSAKDDPFTLFLKGRLLNEWTEIHDSFGLTQLTPGSAAAIKKKTVLFQGEYIQLQVLLDEDAALVPGVLNDDFIVNVLTSKTVSLGPHLEESLSNYIPRVLLRQIVFGNDVLKDRNLKDVFIVFNETKQQLKMLVPPGQSVGNLGHPTSAECRFFVPGSSIAHNVTEELTKRDNVHRLRMIEGGLLVWLETKGNIHNIMKYIDDSWRGEYKPNTALDINDRVVIISAEAGMGKSTLMTYLASMTKKAQPSFWVIRVNLRDHMKRLSKIYDDAVSFISSAVDISQSKTESALFRYSMLTKGNCVVFLDGFDEIAPRYTREGLALLTCLLKTKANRIFITSRREMRTKLESHLSTVTFTLRRFDVSDQREFFYNFWHKDALGKEADGELKQFIDQLVDLIARSLNDKNKEFMGIPLQTMMLAEMYKNNFKNQTKQLPENLNILTIFDNLIDKIFNIYIRKKFHDELNTEPEMEILKQSLYKNHMHASLVLLLDNITLQSLTNGNKIIVKCAKFCLEINASNCKIGIITEVLNDLPIFLHRAFAEFFAAVWFTKNFHDNQGFLRNNLYRDEMNVVRTLFDLKLASKSDLLTAVVNDDLKQVRSLLDTGSDVNATDEGGRSAVHLAVISTISHPHSFTHRKTFIDHPPQNMLQLLLDHGATIDVVDRVLGWNPLEYAVNTISLLALEQLLINSPISTSLALLPGGIENTIMSGTNDTDGPSTLIHAVGQYGFVNIVVLLIASSPINLWALDGEGRTPLHVACEYGEIQVARALIQSFGTHKKDRSKYINLQDNIGYSSLHLACRDGFSDLVKILVSEGGDIRVRDNKHRTPLHIACLMGEVDAAQALIQSMKGATSAITLYVNGRDSEGNSALHCCSWKGPPCIVRLLISKGGDIWALNDDHRSPLHDACENGNLDAAKALIESLGDDGPSIVKYINLKDKYNWTAKGLALVSREIDRFGVIGDVDEKYESTGEDKDKCVKYAKYAKYIHEIKKEGKVRTVQDFLQDVLKQCQ